MEYTGYSEYEILKDKRKNTRRLVLLSIPFFMGLIILGWAISATYRTQVEDAKTIPYTSMKADAVYYFEQLELLNEYAYTGQENSSSDNAASKHYLVRFTDANGEQVYAGLRVEEGSTLEELCNKYMADKDSTPGDIVLSGCFHSFSIKDSDQAVYFTARYILFNRVEPGQCLSLEFTYDDCETIEDYRHKDASNNIILFVVPAVFLVPTVLGGVFLIRKRLKLNRYLQECYEKYPSADEGY